MGFPTANYRQTHVCLTVFVEEIRFYQMCPSSATYVQPATRVRDQKAQQGTVSGNSDAESDDGDLKDLDGELKKCFTGQVKDLAGLKRNVKVAALLISWKKEHESQLDTSEEIRDLKAVFEDSYHFTVRDIFLESSHGQAKHQLNRALADFLLEHDKPDTLLIVYYGGHGRMDLKGDKIGLTMAQGNPSATSILWDQVQGQLESALADRLLIFDCCHAGILERLPRGLKEQSLYEFIGSTPFNQTALGPGPRSFTRALINSLKKLANKVDGFFTSELLHEINISPDFFETGQQPVSSELCSHVSFKRLWIRPLPEALPDNNSDTDVDHENVDTFRCCLTLNYTLWRKPTEADARAIANSIHSLIEKDKVPIRQACWQKLGRVVPADCAETTALSAIFPGHTNVVSSYGNSVDSAAEAESAGNNANANDTLSVSAPPLAPVRRSTEINHNVTDGSHVWLNIVPLTSSIIVGGVFGGLSLFCLGVLLAVGRDLPRIENLDFS